MNFLKSCYCRVYQGCFKAMSPLLPYREPEILESLEKVRELLESKGIKSVLLVTDKPIRGLGLTKNLEEDIEKSSVNLCVFDGVVPNPTISCIEKGLEVYKAGGCEAIIAFGGGSVMDCAKIIGARAVKPNMKVSKMKGILKIRKKLPLFVAVPTTAGTGSEVTVAAVITDDQTHHKYPINDFCLIPHYAVLDAGVTIGLPKSITSTTGLDALTHAVEAYIGRSTTKKTREMSERAVGLISKYLLRAYRNGEDFEARSGMLKSAYYAGIAFTRSFVGYVHAVAHSLGGKYGVPHGLANAIILPYFLEEYGDTVEKPLSRLAGVIGIKEDADTDKEASRKFVEWVKSLNREMQIPDKVKELKEEDIFDLATKADKEANPLYPVPKLMDRDELVLMYKKLLP